MGGTGRGGWGHLQGAVHMAAAKLGCKKTMVGTKWAHSNPGYMNRHRKPRPQVWLLSLKVGFSFGVRAQTEINENTVH